jgi:hypothetical protein
MVSRVEEGVVDRFLQEHRFSDVEQCRRASRWPLSRMCCPLSLAAEKGNVLMVILLLQRVADPAKRARMSCQKVEARLRYQQVRTAGQRYARRLLERAAGETGRRLAAESGAFWSIYHIMDAIGREWEEPLFRDLQRNDPSLRRLAQAA